MKKLILLISILTLFSGCVTVNVNVPDSDLAEKVVDIVNNSNNVQEKTVQNSLEESNILVSTQDTKKYPWNAPVFEDRFRLNLYAINFINATYFDLTFGDHGQRYYENELYDINESPKKLTYVSIKYEDGTIRYFATESYNPVVVQDTEVYMGRSIEYADEGNFRKADYWALVALKYNDSQKEKIQLMRTGYLINLYEIDEALKCAEMARNDPECVELADKFIVEIENFQDSL
ncbi:hypothetical protein HNP86_001602 [Methanococcus maripaludis]|uniref:Lipoprotein n=1 Tax=Methanococcus maripaludis TaxID=39152 RepID=A0A7J9NUU3_METMI|nr:hypothetical protein [Methanococcus maripaludis]MBA2851449.1 hypothetical protein [Methanococcus maripaludis]